jgi:hypothetical protein
MPANPRRIYFDANVFLAYVGNEAGRADTVQALLDEARRGEIEIVTSVLSVAEVPDAVATGHWDHRLRAGHEHPATRRLDRSYGRRRNFGLESVWVALLGNIPHKRSLSGAAEAGVTRLDDGLRAVRHLELVEDQ